MPRDINGTFSLVAGNPVVPGTTITAAWANPTLEDVAQGITNSLDRQGRGGMQAPFLFFDGVINLPGAAWLAEPTSGLYRAAPGELRLSVLANDKMRWKQPGGTQVWNTAASSWDNILTSDAGTATNVPIGTVTGQIVEWNNSTTKWAIAAPLVKVPGGTIAGQILSWNGTAWIATSAPAAGIAPGTIEGAIPYWSVAGSAWTESTLVKVDATNSKVGLGNPTFTSDFKNMVLGKSWVGSTTGTGWTFTDVFSTPVLAATNSSGVSSSGILQGATLNMQSLAGALTLSATGGDVLITRAVGTQLVKGILNGTSIASKDASQIQVVATLPGSPDANTLYFVMT